MLRDAGIKDINCKQILDALPSDFPLLNLCVTYNAMAYTAFPVAQKYPQICPVNVVIAWILLNYNRYRDSYYCSALSRYKFHHYHTAL